MSRTTAIAANPGTGFSLLKTKLQVPILNHTMIPRPHLTARLDSNMPVTVVAAPPGSGKTTLLAEWARHSAQPVGWLTLDELDNDLSRFVAYLSAAAHGQTRGEAASDFASEANPQAILQATTSAALNRLAEAPLTLILDDFHVITNAVIHDTVRFIIEHLPSPARLVIAGRTHPPLPLARLRVTHCLTQITDLNFTLDEAAVLLDLPPDDERAHLLTERTEGWIAGLQLAALWLRGRGEARAFGAGYRHLYQYFLEEIFSTQPTTIQNFLLHTAFLDPLTAVLCNAVTGRSDGQPMLERLEQLNLFITPLDDLRQAFRYHRLFAEFLRERLAQEANVDELHLRTSLAYEQSGNLSKAVEHALVARDWERAAGLIERCAGRGMDVTAWVARLPEALRDGSLTLPEPLSQRETEVLHMILSGMSNPEIARRLIIAVSTVKTHVKNIYRKLDVDTRYEAMQRARELDLLQIRMEAEYRRMIK